jgi:hypothetical protein
MDHVPPTNTAGSDNGRSVWAIAFEMRVTLGNLLTIGGGLCVAGVMLVQVTQYAAELNGKIDRLELRAANIECSLAVAGIAPTTTPCVKAPWRASSSP